MDYSGHGYLQKGPRAHHFAAVVSIAVGLSFLFESYSSYVFQTVFSIFNGVPFTNGPHAWGILFIAFGIFLFIPHFMVVRGVVESIMSLIWMWFGLFALWASLLGPEANTFGSFTGILSLAVSGVCILAAANLRRDFKKGFYKKKVKQVKQAT